MVSKQLSICLLFLGITLIGVVNSQRITTPLKKINNGYLFFTVKYGTDNCEVNMVPAINQCSNVISELNPIPNHCGSKYVGINEDVSGSIFYAPVKLGEVEAQMLYTVPDKNSPIRGANRLCFSMDSSDLSSNILEELLLEKKITSKVAYFYKNGNPTKKDEPTVVGTLTIGEPIPSLSKGQFTPLKKRSSDNDNYSAVSTTHFTAFGQQIACSQSFYINISDDYIGMSEDSFDALVAVMNEKGTYVDLVEEGYFIRAYIRSIDKLEPLQFSLLKEDGVSTFEISLSPSQYTNKLADGTYQLMIDRLFYGAATIIGEAILQSYNLGFDSENKRILIAEKPESQNQSLRGIQIKL